MVKLAETHYTFTEDTAPSRERLVEKIRDYLNSIESGDYRIRSMSMNLIDADGYAVSFYYQGDND